ncbi:MAG: ABC transporter permease subunit [Syntrophomonadaceae bacterium]|jgi:ABC-type transport system involved in multi-copper enzyme maturation permease subunit
MRLSQAMKGLLDKEWRHSRGYLLATLLFIIFAPVIKTSFYLFQGTAQMELWGQELHYALQFGTGLRRPETYSGLLQWLPLTGAVLLGIIILGEEQRGSLRYLASMPVSRRQIILAKFFSGAAAILLAMLINGLFLIALDCLYPMPYNGINVLNWVLLVSALCLGYFTMALMVSTFTTGVLAAGAVVYLLNFLPGMVAAMIEGIAARYFAVAESISINILKLGSYLDLFDYVTRSERNITSVDHFSNWLITGTTANSGIGPDYLLESLILLAGVLLFLVLAVIIFERISLQTGGSIFVTSTARKLGMGIAVLCISYWLVFPRAETLLIFIVYYLVLTVFIYTGTEYLYRSLHQGWQLPGRKRLVR